MLPNFTVDEEIRAAMRGTWVWKKKVQISAVIMIYSC
jgi:hypothetical protein